jgi:hypothetical protein
MDGSTYDSPMPGALEALQELSNEGYEIVIFSTRDAEQIRQWMIFWKFPPYRITNTKLPAVAIIDDRGIRFVNWGKAKNDIHKYVPINKENN